MDLNDPLVDFKDRNSPSLGGGGFVTREQGGRLTESEGGDHPCAGSVP